MGVDEREVDNEPLAEELDVEQGEDVTVNIPLDKGVKEPLEDKVWPLAPIGVKVPITGEKEGKKGVPVVDAVKNMGVVDWDLENKVDALKVPPPFPPELVDEAVK